jgi:RNA polymerase sigma factor (sigma-70 family)
VPQTIRAQTSAIASGDADAMSAFYERWFDFVFAEARQLSRRDEAFCLDMVQDTMMRVIRSMKTLENEAAVIQWLRKTVRSCCIDRVRRELRQAKRERALADGQRDAEPSAQADHIAWLAHELELLNPEAANLLHMRFGLGWTLQRIGTAIGVKTGAVDGRINRILTALRARSRETLDE